MPKIRSLRYLTRQGDQRLFEFHDGNLDPGFQMTLLTGQNGSQKSSVLRDLVSAIVLPTDKANVRSTVFPASQLRRRLFASPALWRIDFLRKCSVGEIQNMTSQTITTLGSGQVRTC